MFSRALHYLVKKSHTSHLVQINPTSSEGEPHFAFSDGSKHSELSSPDARIRLRSYRSIEQCQLNATYTKRSKSFTGEFDQLSADEAVDIGDEGDCLDQSPSTDQMVSPRVRLQGNTGTVSDSMIDPHPANNHFWLAMNSADAGDIESLEYCLNTLGVPLNKQTPHGVSLLHCAARSDRITTLKYLIRHGANTEVTTSRGRTPLHTAARNGSVNCLKFLMKEAVMREKNRSVCNKPASNGGRFLFLLCPDYNGDTLLHLACRQSQDKTLKLTMRIVIIYLGWTALEEMLQSQNSNGETPLHVACLYRSVSCVRLLISKECRKIAKSAFRFVRLRKTIAALREASTRTIEWVYQNGTVLHHMAKSKCTCQNELILQSDNADKEMDEAFVMSAKDGECDGMDIDVPEWRCKSCDDAMATIVKLLLRYSPHLADMRDSLGQTPLMCAAMNDAVGIVESLLTHGVDIETVDCNYRTALHHAATRGVSRQVAILLSHGAYPVPRDEKGATPMHYAAVRGFTASLRLLYRANNFKDVATSNGHTAFMWAAMNNVVLSLNTFLSANPMLSRWDEDNDGCTALHLAAERNCLAAVKLLLQCGWNPEARNRAEQTPILLAAYRGCTAVLTPLFNFHCNIFAVDSNGNTVLHLASLSESTASTLRELLYTFGDSLTADVFNYDGNTPLHLAIENSAVSCVRELLLCGASTRLKNSFGYDALMSAIKKGCWPILTLIIKGAPDINSYSTVDNHTPLSLALECHNLVLATFLQANGAVMPHTLVDSAARKIQRWYRRIRFYRKLMRQTALTQGSNIRRICAALGENMLKAECHYDAVSFEEQSLFIC
ncbi:hypothetical protein AB6A40_003793 [Gnathostoma spinigerum]|uniref:Ankyrin repeat protein n=1 Tax=Gnathostoma spinigerum TaxID=75299 RepID=A0ABD6EAK0_9BILA